MGIVNSILNIVFDILIVPFRAIHPWVGLLVVSAVMAVVALLAFRVAANADAITRVKTRISAYLLEMRLYRDDLGVLLKDPLKIMGLNLQYVAHAFGPFLLILPPMLLAIFQIEARWAEPLSIGQSALVTVTFADQVDVLADGLTLEASPGLTVETPPVRIAGRREATWRVSGGEAGRQSVVVTAPGRAADQSVQKLIWVEQQPRSMSRARSARYAGFGALAEPAEAPLDGASGIREIRVSYQTDETRPLGLSGAVWIFFGLSTLIGFALKDVLRVTI